MLKKDVCLGQRVKMTENSTFPGAIGTVTFLGYREIGVRLDDFWGYDQDNGEEYFHYFIAKELNLIHDIDVNETV